MATLSLWAAYQWDNTLFDGMTIPDELNKSILVNNLLMESAELELIYADVDFLKQAITYWSASRQRAWNTMQKVLYEQYDPFVNIKRDETREIVQNRNLQTKMNRNLKSVEDRDLTNELTNDLQTDNDTTTTTSTAAWDSATLIDTEKQVIDGTVTNTGTATTTDTGTVTTDDTGDVTTNDTGNVITTEHFHVEGDSAITDAQDVAVKEFKLRADYDLYRYIIQDFKKRFCLLIY